MRPASETVRVQWGCDGGEWLKGAGQFNFLERLTAEDWEAMRPKKE
jgi:hypothetical protein